jgi:hypothetical protein
MKINNKLIVYFIVAYQRSMIKDQQSTINDPKSGEGDHLVRRIAASPDKLQSFKKSCVILLSSLRWSMKTKTIKRKISHLYVSFVEITLMAQGSIKVIIKELKTPRNG